MRFLLATVHLAAGVSLVGCGLRAQSIKIDGSNTVYPISEAVAEAYGKAMPSVCVTVANSGTGAGMQRLTAGEISLCGASRRIQDSESAVLDEAGVAYTEYSIALDGIAVVVHPENNWCDSLTVEQLASIWRPNDPVNKWSELNQEWPDEPIKLYGPGNDSGTFEYFTEAIVGEAKACRTDFAASDDDNVLVTGVSSDKHSMGYISFAYCIENTDRLKLLGIANGEADPVQPSVETIRDSRYAPLSRPLLIYVRNDFLESEIGVAFLKHYLEKAGDMAGKVGYVAVSDKVASENQTMFEAALPER